MTMTYRCGGTIEYAGPNTVDACAWFSDPYSVVIISTRNHIFYYLISVIFIWTLNDDVVTFKVPLHNVQCTFDSGQIAVG